MLICSVQTIYSPIKFTFLKKPFLWPAPLLHWGLDASKSLAQLLSQELLSFQGFLCLTFALDFLFPVSKTQRCLFLSWSTSVLWNIPLTFLKEKRKRKNDSGEINCDKVLSDFSSCDWPKRGFFVLFCLWSF